MSYSNIYVSKSKGQLILISILYDQSTPFNTIFLDFNWLYLLPLGFPSALLDALLNLLCSFLLSPQTLMLPGIQGSELGPSLSSVYIPQWSHGFAYHLCAVYSQIHFSIVCLSLKITYSTAHPTSPLICLRDISNISCPKTNSWFPVSPHFNNQQLQPFSHKCQKHLKLYIQKHVIFTFKI